MTFEPQVEPDHYGGLTYNDAKRFVSYWKQIEQVASVARGRILEVGIGNGFVSRFLRTEMSLDVHTVDGDVRLKPDTVADVCELPFAARSFDVACCFETLEHLPYSKFEPALAELARVARRHVLFSVPDVVPYARIRLEWGDRRTWFAKFFDLPNLRPETHAFNGEHYWEIGWRGYPLKRILDSLSRVGLELVGTSRLEADPYHRFFNTSIGSSSRV